MGQAKQRGTREERIAQAKARPRTLWARPAPKKASKPTKADLTFASMMLAVMQSFNGKP
jgi:hypothetical protein